MEIKLRYPIAIVIVNWLGSASNLIVHKINNGMPIANLGARLWVLTDIISIGDYWVSVGDVMILTSIVACIGYGIILSCQVVRDGGKRTVVRF